MGKIQVGQKRPKTVDMGGFTIAPNDAAATNKVCSAEEKSKQDEKNEQTARANRLAEIKALPEEEQLPLLLEEGFENEAKELSEHLAKLNDETSETISHDSDGDGDQNDEGDGETSEKENKEKSAPKLGVRKSSK